MDQLHQMVGEAVKDFQKAFTHLKEEFAKLQIGRASAALVEGVMVESYGSVQPLKSVASISVADARTLNVQPWDRSQLHKIEDAIRKADIGINPNNNGVMVILNIPPLTQERRAMLAKTVGKLSEEAKIAVRNSRQHLHGRFRQMKEAKEMTEDDQRLGEKLLQEKVDDYNKQIEEGAKQKEQDIMTV